MVLSNKTSANRATTSAVSEPVKSLAQTNTPPTRQTLTHENYQHTVLRFRSRQAGVSTVFDPFDDVYRYNAYCIETKLLKELVSVEYAFLDDALDFINDEFGSWEEENLDKKASGCGSCAAKKR